MRPRTVHGSLLNIVFAAALGLALLWCQPLCSAQAP